MGYYSQNESLPSKTLKKCPMCGWVGETTLKSCYRRSMHDDRKPVFLESEA